MKTDYIMNEKKVAENIRNNTLNILMDSAIPEKLATAFLKRQAFLTGDKVAFERAFNPSSNNVVTRDDIINETWCIILELINKGVLIIKSKTLDFKKIFIDTPCITKTITTKKGTKQENISIIAYLFDLLGVFFYHNVTNHNIKIGGSADIIDGITIDVNDVGKIGAVISYDNIESMFADVHSFIYQATLENIPEKYQVECKRYIYARSKGVNKEKSGMFANSSTNHNHYIVLDKVLKSAFIKACDTLGKNHTPEKHNTKKDVYEMVKKECITKACKGIPADYKLISTIILRESLKAFNKLDIARYNGNNGGYVCTKDDNTKAQQTHKFGIDEYITSYNDACKVKTVSKKGKNTLIGYKELGNNTPIKLTTKDILKEYERIQENRKNRKYSFID